MELIQKKFEKALELAANGKSQLLNDGDRYKIVGKLICDEMIDDMPNDEELIFMLAKCANLFDIKPVEKVVIKEVGDETYNANVRLIDRLQQQLQEMSFKVIDDSVIKRKEKKIEYLQGKVKRLNDILSKLTERDFNATKDTFENYLEVEELQTKLNKANEELAVCKRKINQINSLTVNNGWRGDIIVV